MYNLQIKLHEKSDKKEKVDQLAAVARLQAAICFYKLKEGEKRIDVCKASKVRFLGTINEEERSAAAYFFEVDIYGEKRTLVFTNVSFWYNFYESCRESEELKSFFE